MNTRAQRSEFYRVIGEADKTEVPRAQAETRDTSYEYRVSSRTLKLASAWFKRVLNKGGWAESSLDADEGKLHIKAEDWDPDVFLVVLNVCHLRNKEVPKALSVEMLADIALIAD